MSIQKLTKEQAIVITGFTGVVCGNLADFHDDVQKRLRHPVWTHQFADKDLWQKIKELYAKDFILMATLNVENFYIINWGMESPKCNHNEATIHSTAKKDSGYEFMHGDAVTCNKCGNTGEMDAQGEDSDIVWNEDEP